MKTKDYLLALLTSILWGGNFIATKYGVDTFGIFGLSLIRMISVSVVFFPYLTTKNLYFKEIIKISLVYGIGFVTFLNISLQYTNNPTIIVILIQTVVPFGAILSYVHFKEKINVKEVVGMAMAFLGICKLIGLPSSLYSIISIIAVLLASYCQAWQMILVKKYKNPIDIKTLLAWIHILNIPLFLILALLFRDFSAQNIKSIIGWVAALYTGLISTAIGLTIWFSLLKKYQINKVSPFMILVPFFGVLLSIFFFDSPLTEHVIIGGILIICGVALIQFSHRPT
jgi:O-acetylserine/cysteine efflux transporter